MRYTGPKMKLCRREGYNLFGTEKYNLEDNHRQVKRGKKLSEFGVQLRKKQAAKRQYAVSEKQFSRYYQKAANTPGVTGDQMITLLETRFDNVVLRANFARTIMQARQFVSHAHFTVNGQKVDIPSYQISVGDIIEVREKLKDTPLYRTLQVESEEFLKNNQSGRVSAVDWIEADPKAFKIVIKRLPETQDYDQSVDMKKIIEFYSK